MHRNSQKVYIYILDSGTSLISNTSAEDIVVSKYDSTGTKVWNKYYGGLKTESISDSYANYRSEIKAHPDGGFVLQCITRSLEFAPSGSTAINEPIVIKGDINGIQKWWATIDRAATAAHGLKIKPNGNILLYGKGNTSPTSPFATPNDLKSKAFITELRNSDGKMIWGTSFGGDIDDENRALSIIDNQNFIVGGRHSEEFAWVYHVKLEGATHNSTIISNQDIFIYPNPVGSQLFVKTENHSNMEYSILGSNGNLIEKGNLKSENSIDVENLSPGIYFLNLTSYRETLFLKFIKF